MAYPEPRYTGDTGEVTAQLRPAGREPDIVNPSGTMVHYLATGKTTGGGFGLYRYELGPGPGGAGAHFHRTFSESFYVLSGIVTVFDGRNWAEARPGDFLYVPEGGLHGFRNDSGERASMLILFAPGAPREAYFEGLAEMAGGRVTMTDEEKQEFFRLHDNIYL